MPAPIQKVQAFAVRHLNTFLEASGESTVPASAFNLILEETLPVGGRRQVLVQALRELNLVTHDPVAGGYKINDGAMKRATHRLLLGNDESYRPISERRLKNLAGWYKAGHDLESSHFDERPPGEEGEEVQELKRQLAEALERAEAAEARATKLETQLAEATQQTEIAKAETDSLRQRLDTSGARVTKLMGSLETSNQNLQLEHGAHQLTKDALRTSEARVDELETQLKKASDELSGIRQLEEALERSEGSVRAGIELHSETLGALQVAQARVTELEAELARVEHELIPRIDGPDIAFEVTAVVNGGDPTRFVAVGTCLSQVVSVSWQRLYERYSNDDTRITQVVEIDAPLIP